MAQPSVSQEDPEGVRKCAALLARYYRDLGCQEVEIVQTPSLPCVWAYYDAGARRTLVVYSYFDTNVVGDGWDYSPYDVAVTERPPFRRVVYGRGATCKGAFLAFIIALSAIREVEGNLPMNLMFLSEGEEFLGSPHIPFLIERYRDRLAKTDAVLWPGPCQTATGDVSLFLGNKGCLAIELMCSGDRWRRGPVGGATHSSTQCVVDSPAWRLIQVLSTLYDPESNRILVNGFYNGLREPNAADMALIDSLADRYRGKENTAIPGIGPDSRVDRFLNNLTGRDLFLRFCFHPTMNIYGLRAGFTGPGTVLWTLPNTAYCNIDCRLPPDLDPNMCQEMIREHLDRSGYADIEIKTLMSVGAQKLSIEDDIAQAALRVFRLWNKTPIVWPRRGVSGPAGYFSQLLGLSVLGSTGMGYASGHAGPNEFLVVEGNESVGGLRELEQSYADLIYAYAAYPAEI